jgi:metal-sulfur cluster biosynthetic enzyme
VSIPYEAAVAGDRAIAELQKTLNAFGCQSFGVMTDQERQVMIVAFKWRDRQVHLEASWAGYAQALIRKSRWRPEEAFKQAKIAVCSVLRDWVKGQTTAVECGVMSFETAFLPHMLLKDGRRVIDAAEQAGVLPPPEASNVRKLEDKRA